MEKNLLVDARLGNGQTFPDWKLSRRIEGMILKKYGASTAFSLRVNIEGNGFQRCSLTLLLQL